LKTLDLGCPENEAKRQSKNNLLCPFSRAKQIVFLPERRGYFALKMRQSRKNNQTLFASFSGQPEGCGIKSYFLVVFFWNIFLYNNNDILAYVFAPESWL
jgi:hypothetical protein